MSRVCTNLFIHYRNTFTTFFRCDDYENVCNMTTKPSTTGTTSATTSAASEAPVTETTRPTSTVTQSSGFCITPSCKTDLQKNTLWAHPDRNLYYQCAPHSNGSYQPLARACGPDTVFHYKLQVCVWESDWEDPCSDGNKPAPVRTTSAPPPAKPKKGYFYPKKYHQWNYIN